jgi:hypothetical protein
MEVRCGSGFAWRPAAASAGGVLAAEGIFRDIGLHGAPFGGERFDSMKKAAALSLVGMSLRPFFSISTSIIPFRP